MRRFILVVLLAVFVPALLSANEIAVTMFKLKPEGLANSIGVVVAKDTRDGLELTPYLQGLPPGEYHFNVHENMGCGSQVNPDGSMTMGMAAGPILKRLSSVKVDENGAVTGTILARNLGLDDVRKRTFVLSTHSAEETMMDKHPMGSEMRIACGSLELY
ncbi:MAG TPA: hypothetical protein EYP40_01680 [Chromatiales bacterium]|nr:hypothetical protein [Chromatiales bacterium]